MIFCTFCQLGYFFTLKIIFKPKTLKMSYVWPKNWFGEFLGKTSINLVTLTNIVFPVRVNSIDMVKGSFTLAFLPRQKRWHLGHSFYVCCHVCIWQPRQANPCTLGRDVLKNRTFSIFQTASPQGFPLNLPCLNLYLWQKTCTSMAKTSDENAEQKRQCKRAFSDLIFCVVSGALLLQISVELATSISLTKLIIPSMHVWNTRSML